jgi:TM2 domain-containing membrane protein YozV
MNENDVQKLQRNVLERVKRGVPMRSRAYFVGRIFATAATAVLVLAVSAYVFSFIAFSLHESGEQFLLGFGSRGIQTFFVLFPWIPAIADILLIVLLEWLLQGFRFGYRIPLLTLFLVALILSGALALAINATPLNDQLLDLADRGQLPLIGPAYEGIRSSHRNADVFRGSITAIDGTEVTISHNDNDHDADDGTWVVALPPGYATTSLSVGEQIIVLGTPNGPVIQADGMEEMGPPPPPGR